MYKRNVSAFKNTLVWILQKIIIYSDESKEDFLTKLQSLSGIGRVSVDSTDPADTFGQVWVITFLSNPGDVPLLRHYGTSNLQGTGASLNIREQSRAVLVNNTS